MSLGPFRMIILRDMGSSILHRTAEASSELQHVNDESVAASFISRSRTQDINEGFLWDAVSGSSG